MPCKEVKLMSCERRVKTFFETEEVKIEFCNRDEIETLENNIISLDLFVNFSKSIFFAP